MFVQSILVLYYYHIIGCLTFCQYILRIKGLKCVKKLLRTCFINKLYEKYEIHVSIFKQHYLSRDHMSYATYAYVYVYEIFTCISIFQS